MNSLQQERHVLILNTVGGRRAIALEAAAYSLGRDESNAIVIDFETVSRQHAILLRVPVPGTTSYRYRLVDGNANGKPSTNGTFVNGKRISSHELQHGDVILFGRKAKASYLMLSMADTEFSQYLQSIAFQSIKSDLRGAKETLVGMELSGELRRTPSRELVAAAATQLHPEAEPAKETLASESDREPQGNNKETVHEKESQGSKTSLVGLGAIALVVVAIIAGAVWRSGFSPSQPQSTPPATQTRH
ncbi:FHA domain-containing protein [Thermosynechococcus sp. B0]|uniref:FHA domain-containing protein n=1 Tax=unclassified Thermosynechococcus TaxID=2622553 RepID=UPI0025750DD2|nr:MULTISPECIES: FHA domain-containing protein [unclassified Thermosynechococcus]WJI23114.1 FHA domain-containing protein [Thermosynechococcus sp. B0]WJI28160.1 FHA domain-containing protein [Thermosynechococcus sp. B3]